MSQGSLHCRGDAHTAHCRDCVSLCLLSRPVQEHSGQQGCCFASLWGWKREWGIKKQSCTTGSQKSAIPFCLLAGVQVRKEEGREAAFFNHVVNLQELEIRGYSQIFPYSFFKTKGKMLLCTSDGAAFPCDCRGGQASPGCCQCWAPSPEGLSLARWTGHWVGLPAGALHLLYWGWCCCQLSLPSLEISFVPSCSSEELKRSFPLVFQIFCSRCSSHSAPLPRYGQMKPVRVCTHCYMFHVTPFYSDRAGIWHIKLLVCLLESYMDWCLWPKPRTNLKEGPSEGT